MYASLLCVYSSFTSSTHTQDLCDQLWDICDVRKGEWEVERNRIMTEHWLEDHLGLIINTYISIMQVHISPSLHLHMVLETKALCALSVG